MNVWVIWATVHRVNLGEAQFATPSTGLGYYVPNTEQDRRKFIFDINPKKLFTPGAELPILDNERERPVPGKGVRACYAL
jgi:hypothetical protein